MNSVLENVLILKSFLDSILLSIVITSGLVIFRDLKISNSFYGFCFKYFLVYISIKRSKTQFLTSQVGNDQLS